MSQLIEATRQEKASLIEAAKQKAADERQAIWREYREILEQDNPKDAKRLVAVSGKLGLSMDLVARDQTVVRRAAQLEQRAAPADDPQLEAEMKAAYNAYAAYAEETKRIAQEREVEERRLEANWSSLQSRQSMARDARRQLSEVMMRRPDLFGLAPREPAQEPRVTQTVGIPQHDPEKEKADAARLNRVRAFQNAGTTVREKATGRITCIAGAVDWDRYERLDANEEVEVLRQLERGEQPHLEG